MKFRKILAACLSFAVSSAVLAQTITLKVGDNWNDTHPMAAAVNTVFKPQVEKGTNGAIKVDVWAPRTTSKKLQQSAFERD